MRAPRDRDAKRQKVYDWERTLPCRVVNPKELVTSPLRMSREQCRALVRWASRRYGVRVDGLTFLFRDAFTDARYNPAGDYISLPAWARQPVVVLHEAAHRIVDIRGSRVWVEHDALCELHPAWHGPEFLQVFCDLLVACKPLGVTKGMLRASLKGRKLKRARGAKKIRRAEGHHPRCPWTPRTVLRRVRLGKDVRALLDAESAPQGTTERPLPLPQAQERAAASPKPQETPPAPVQDISQVQDEMCPGCQELLLRESAESPPVCTNPRCTWTPTPPKARRVRVTRRSGASTRAV